MTIHQTYWLTIGKEKKLGGAIAVVALFSMRTTENSVQDETRVTVLRGCFCCFDLVRSIIKLPSRFITLVRVALGPLAKVAQ